MGRYRGVYSAKVPTYSTAHQRVQNERGWARAHPCVDCGERAAHWSYDHQDPGELTEIIHGREMTYSPNPERYNPRCLSCHISYDLPAWSGIDGEDIGPRCGTYAGWNQHKRGATKPCAACRVAAAEYMRAWRKRKREEGAA